MNIVIIFAHLFDIWAREIILELQAQNPAVRVTGLCMTRQVYDRVKADKRISFARLDNLEELEEHWTALRPDQAELEKLEAEWGADALRRIVISDRQVGAGYIAAGPLTGSALTKDCRDDGAVRGYVSGLLNYIDEIFREQQPEAALVYVVAGSIGLAVSEACARHGAKFCNFAHTRFRDRVILDHSAAGLMLPVAEIYRKGASAEHRAEAETYLRDFRDSLGRIPEYEVQNRARFSKSRQPLHIAKNFLMTAAKTAVYPLVRGRRPYRGESGGQKLWRSVAWPVAGIYAGKYRAYKTADLSRPFIYFALHLEPEASTMVVSPYHTNQLAVIEAISKAMPLSWQLVVKEHPSMLGRRPADFYRRIEAMPGVTLVAPQENSLRLVSRAAITATITGTVAWEAILLGKPALVIGDSPFLAIGAGAVHCQDFTALPQAIAQAAKLPPASDEQLIQYICAMMDESVSFPHDMLWGKPTPAFMAQHKNVTEFFVKKILAAVPQAKQRKSA